MASRKPYVSDEASPEVTSDGKISQHDNTVDVVELTEKLGDTIPDGVAPIDDIELVLDKVQLLTVDECRSNIEKLLKDHEYDYNFSAAQKHKLESLLAGPKEDQSTEDWELQMKTETAVNKYFSPYPEVRSVT